jgi:hypothetical protein
MKINVVVLAFLLGLIVLFSNKRIGMQNSDVPSDVYSSPSPALSSSAEVFSSIRGIRTSGMNRLKKI